MHRLLYTSCVSNTEVLNCFNPRFFCSVVHVFIILISINVFCFQLQFSLLYISMISMMCSSNVCTLNNHIILQYSLMGVKSAVDKSTGDLNIKPTGVAQPSKHMKLHTVFVLMVMPEEVLSQKSIGDFYSLCTLPLGNLIL